MLTRAQIQRLAQRHNMGVQAQERDYIQYLLLMLLYSRSQSLLFKGGTALRIVYRAGRYSEDLDFNGTIDVDEIKDLWGGLLDELRGFGINAEIRNEWLAEVGYSFDVNYQGPLYDGRDRTKGKVRVDISLRHEEVDTGRELVSSEYDDVRPFVATVLTREHLVAEKVRALLMRGKARDVYDLWLLSNQGVFIQPELVSRKLSISDVTLSRASLNDSLDRAGKDWERDMRPLLSQFVRWEDILKQVQPILDRLI